MPGTTLRDLDLTDIETLLPWYAWKTSELRERAASEGEIVERGGKMYRKVAPQATDWMKKGVIC